VNDLKELKTIIYRLIYFIAIIILMFIVLIMNVLFWFLRQDPSPTKYETK